MNFLKKRKCAKFIFNFTIHHLTKISKNGSILFVSWKRGKKWSGETKKAFVKDKTAVWDEDYSLKGTLFISTGQKFKKKFLNIYIYENNKDQKKSVIGELKINLADYASQLEDKSETKIFNVKLWRKDEAQLKIKIDALVRKKGEGGGLDTDISEATTMTEMSDEDDDDGIMIDDNESSKLSRTQILLDKRRTNLSRTPTRLSPRRVDDDDYSLGSEESPRDVKSDDASSEEEKVKSPKQRSNLSQRRSNNLSIDGSSDDFLENIKSADKLADDNNSDENSEEREERECEKERQKELEAKKLAVAKLKEQEQEMKQIQQKLQQMQQEQNETTLIDVLINNKQPEYSSKGYPVSAPVLFRACLHFESFTPKKNNLLKKIVKAIDTIVSRSEDNPAMLAYWLSGSVVLLNLLQKEYPVSIDTDDTSDKNDNATVVIEVPDDPLGNDPKRTNTRANAYSYRSPTDIYADEFAFENPIEHFKVEMTRIALNAYLFMLKHVYNQIVQVLITSMYASLGKTGRMNASHTTKILNEYLAYFNNAYVYAPVTHQFFGQVFKYINHHTFNALIAPGGKYCTMGHAIMLKMAVSELEEWAQSKSLPISHELITLRQASDVMIMNKASLLEVATRKEVCSALTIQQLRRVLELYHPDEYDPDQIPQNVLKSLPDTNVKSEDLFVDTSIVRRPNFYFEKPDLPLWKSVQAPDILTENKEFQFLKN